MVAATLKGLLAHTARLVTTGLAVLLGVAFLAGTLVLTDTIRRSFDDLYATVNAGVDLHVRSTSEVADPTGGPQRARVDGGVLATVAGVDGVAAVEGTVQGYAQLVDHDGEALGNPGLGAPTHGASWPEVEALNPFVLAEGRPPTAADEVVIDRASALDAGFEVGDPARIVTASGVHELTVVGITRFGDVDSPAGASYALFAPAVAQAILGVPDRFDALDVVAAEGEDLAALRAAVAAVVPAGTEVLTGAEITAEEQGRVVGNLGFLDAFLLTFAVIALFVGSFIIYNTFSITVAQRTREMALLRAIGASRRQVLGSVLVEAAAIGLVASAAGLAAGVGVAAGLTRILDGFGIDIPADGLVVSARTVVVTLAVGLAVTLASALLPARRAARVPPIAAMRDVALDRSAGSSRRVVAGSALSAVGVGLLALGLVTGGEGAGVWVGLGAAGTFVGIAALGPVIARPVSGLLGSPLPPVLGMTGTLARANAMRNPKRTSATAAALMIGVGLVGSITVMASSAQASIDRTLDRAFLGDLVVEAGDIGFGGLPVELAARVAALPEAGAVAPIRVTGARIAGSDQLLIGTDATALGDVFDLGVAEGALADLGDDGIAVLDDVATEHGWTLGSEVRIGFAETGEQRFEVAAIYTASDIIGIDRYLIDLSAFEANVADQLDTQVFVAVAEGVGVGAAREAAAAVTDDYPTATLRDTEEFKAQQAAQVDQILNLVYVLLALAVVIALIGIANTMALSILERTRELGLLRAVGMTRHQLRSMVCGEAIVIALLGTGLGLGIGLAFGWAVVTALRDVGFTTFVAAPGQLATITAIAALGGLAAAILPARRAARLDVLRAIAAT